MGANAMRFIELLIVCLRLEACLCCFAILDVEST